MKFIDLFFGLGVFLGNWAIRRFSIEGFWIGVIAFVLVILMMWGCRVTGILP